MAAIHLRIDGMHCGSCVRRVTQTMNAVPGTTAEEVVVGAARVQTKAAPEELLTALANAGFRAYVDQ